MLNSILAIRGFIMVLVFLGGGLVINQGGMDVHEENQFR